MFDLSEEVSARRTAAPSDADTGHEFPLERALRAFDAHAENDGFCGVVLVRAVSLLPNCVA